MGVDPGLAETGVGFVCGTGLTVDGYAYGHVSTAKKTALPLRLERIFDELKAVMTAESPDLMMLEDVFSLDVYPKSGITLGKVTGVILLAASQVGLPVVEVPVRQAKKVLTGNGSASKSQLECAVRRLLRAPHPIRPFHASDALAMAIAGLYRHSRRPVIAHRTAAPARRLAVSTRLPGEPR